MAHSVLPCPTCGAHMRMEDSEVRKRTKVRTRVYTCSNLHRVRTVEISEEDHEALLANQKGYSND